MCDKNNSYYSVSIIGIYTVIKRLAGNYLELKTSQLCSYWKYTLFNQKRVLYVNSLSIKLARMFYLF
jgi:hypothetical protein